jgi:hypothetical protein
MTNLAKFRDVCKVSEVLRIGTFVIEFAQAMVLHVITLTKGFKWFNIIGPCEEGK